MPVIPNGVTRGQDLSEQLRETDRLSAQAKNVALAEYASNKSKTRSVTPGVGPSSNVR